MASYQNFIATISNTLTFNLLSEDGNHVRITNRTVTINSQLVNIEVLILNSDFGQPAPFVLKAVPNSDNFSLFIEIRTIEGRVEVAQEFPINIVTDEATGGQFLQVDTNRSGAPLRISPQAINQPGVVVQFAGFTAVTGLSPTIMADSFGFLRIDGGVSVPKFGFSAVQPNINITTATNWRSILPFILNGTALVRIIELVTTVETVVIIAAVAGPLLAIFALPLAAAIITAPTVELNNALAQLKAGGPAIINGTVVTASQLISLNGGANPASMAANILSNGTTVLRQ